MLDVHPPHGKLHGIGDFFLHLFTITVGLLIALGLEAAVDRHHKAELRHEAETNLRQEISTNAAELTKWQSTMAEETKGLILALKFLQAKEHGQPGDVTGIQLGFGITGLSDASWRTASATGALTLMDYGQVQQYASAYQLQDEVMRLEHDTLDGFLLLQSYVVNGFDATSFTGADATAAEPRLRQTLAHLVALQQVSHGLALEYKQALNEAPTPTAR